ncbi:uncharacterized protein K444DRAFT_631561 [Hyaloscypha bicolor E]|uniref:Uncharacterized protein n=1 Tax=Hyaloscypha bicolor E TaxID=1095630 RepID=A0A2J6T475_9HELO|nr:uncharacterized protein K444DRAFT_631561 [Hyaloscypha bicolor E]PMD57828.1 hypothetical protein K444DRAFT_631561 [Hyaloscypha bicolor E]
MPQQSNSDSRFSLRLSCCRLQAAGCDNCWRRAKDRTCTGCTVISSLCHGGLRAAMRRRCHVNCVVEREGGCRGGRNDVVNSFSWQMSNVVASTVSHVLGAVGGAVGAGSKDMGCAPVAGDPGERRQMEAVESLIGDGGGDWAGGLVWGLAAVGRWLEQQGVTEGGTRVVVFPAGWAGGCWELGLGAACWVQCCTHDLK